ncbi:helicase-related protein, partial [Agathobacter rectalis]
SDSQKQRNEVIQQLKDGRLNYIITVDLFNEGIDIPEINQVVMLRSTQ